MYKKYKHENKVKENAKLITPKEWNEIRLIIKESRYMMRDLSAFVLEFYTRHELEKYYGYKKDMRRYLLDNHESCNHSVTN